MPDPNDYPRIQFNATPIIEKIRTRKSRGRSEHQTARRDLKRYYQLLEASRPTLPFRQAKLLCDLLNGTMFEPIDRAPQLLQIEVQDAPDRLFEKWDVSREKFERRVADFSAAEAYATIDAVERFWKEPNETSVVDVGLCGDEATRN